MNAILDWLHKHRHRNTARIPVLICGLDYEHYRVQALVSRSRGYRVQALINDFPWNHGTLVDEVRVYYPSEAPSLVRRHGIAAILYCTQDDLALFDPDTASTLRDLQVPFVRLAPDEVDDFDRFMMQRTGE
ncbi:MAG: hypothetical protein UMU75_05335 [Halomonas sp.]|nr:hypothetical protein [Halomonas sp.]